MKILHSGDLHLDGAFHSLSERQAEIRKNELRAAFTSMMTYARMNDVSLALFAGDIFDCAYATRETLQLLSTEFARFGRPVVIRLYAISVIASYASSHARIVAFTSSMTML